MCTTTPADAARTPDRTATMTNNKAATRRMGFFCPAERVCAATLRNLGKGQDARVNRWKFARKADYLNAR